MGDDILCDLDDQQQKMDGLFADGWPESFLAAEHTSRQPRRSRTPGNVNPPSHQSTSVLFNNQSSAIKNPGTTFSQAQPLSWRRPHSQLNPNPPMLAHAQPLSLRPRRQLDPNPLTLALCRCKIKICNNDETATRSHNSDKTGEEETILPFFNCPQGTFCRMQSPPPSFSANNLIIT